MKLESDRNSKTKVNHLLHSMESTLVVSITPLKCVSPCYQDSKCFKPEILSTTSVSYKTLLYSAFLHH